MPNGIIFVTREILKTGTREAELELDLLQHTLNKYLTFRSSAIHPSWPFGTFQAFENGEPEFKAQKGNPSLFFYYLFC